MNAGVSFLYSRRSLLLRNPPASPPPSVPEPQYPAGDNSFDANVVMVLSVLLCALICSLGLNSIIRCALRCSTFVADSSEPGPGGGGGSARPGGSAAATSGIKKKALKTFPTVSYSSDHANLPGLGSECAICLSEFVARDQVRLLPKCHHGFHVRCIDKWLNSHSSCPKCRHNLLETCHKIVGGGEAPTSSSEPFPAVQEPMTVVNISPLQHEDPIRNYRGYI